MISLIKIIELKKKQKNARVTCKKQREKKKAKGEK